MKIADCGVAVIEGDSHLSQWIEAQGRLDVQRERALIEAVREYIPVGGTVIDVGASLGDHTIVYSELVGPAGHVYAFEPNPAAYECLIHNTKHLSNVIVNGSALGSFDGACGIAADPFQPKNMGTYRLVPGAGVRVERLDAQPIGHIDYIKLDAEGCELHILKGAEATLRRDHPAILMEVNVYALTNQAASRDELYAFLRALDYQLIPLVYEDDPKSTEERLQDRELDVLCVVDKA